MDQYCFALDKAKGLGSGLQVDYESVAQEVKRVAHLNMSTRDTYIEFSRASAVKATEHPDYGLLAGKALMCAVHEAVPVHFSEVVQNLYDADLLAKKFYQRVMAVKDTVDGWVAEEVNDKVEMTYRIEALTTMYEIHAQGRFKGDHMERPRHVWLRASLDVAGFDLLLAREIYDLLCARKITLATPILTNAGTRNSQFSSCFLVTLESDSAIGIYNTLKDSALCSKSGGGLGLHVTRIRASGSRIRSGNGKSNGLVPMLKTFEATANYMDQGGGKRKGKTTVYLEPWHRDFESVVDMKLKETPASNAAPDLFCGVWMPDLLMRRVQNKQNWTMFCPTDAPMLPFSHGKVFEEAYVRYEATVPKEKTIVKPAIEIYHHILAVGQKEGSPFMLFKDTANRRNNLSNVANIAGSNLCTEIIEPSLPDESAVCTLGAVCVHMFVTEEKEMDYEGVQRAAGVLARALDRSIDTTTFPTQKTRNSQLRHRNIGLGAIGLATAYQYMDLSFGSIESQVINYRVFECISKGATDASIELAKLHGPHPSYHGSKRSLGLLNQDIVPKPEALNKKVFNMPFFDPYHEDGRPKTYLDWSATRANMALYGVRNGFTLAPMPTASTSLLTGASSGIDPVFSNAYTIHTIAGASTVVNPTLVSKLSELGVWSASLGEEIANKSGSIQHIEYIPEDVKEVFRTVWEIKTKETILMAQARSIFVDQSQSFNIFQRDPSTHAACIMLTWQMGLITGQYYLTTPQHTRTMEISTLNKSTERARMISSASHPLQRGTTPVPLSPESSSRVESAAVCYRKSEIAACALDALARERDCIMCQ